jgi:hypothetical protein
MKYRIDDSAHAASVQTSYNTSRNYLELLSYILADAESDISTAARDLPLSDAGFIRLRRARDWVAYAQILLETVSEGCRQDSRRGRNITNWERGRTIAGAAMRAAVELLAGEWLEDYPDGAVEWLLLEPRGV